MGKKPLEAPVIKLGVRDYLAAQTNTDAADWHPVLKTSRAYKQGYTWRNIRANLWAKHNGRMPTNEQ